MTSIVRFCPNCKTERSLEELFCDGEINDRRCHWNLSDEPIRQKGWRPAPIVTAEQATQVIQPSTCINGHTLDPTDLICTTCGGDRALTIEFDLTPSPPASAVERDATEPLHETVIDGWRILRQIGSTARIRDRYVVARVDGDQQAVLTLYHHGSEPDPSVYDALKRLPREHVPEIFATGRWNDGHYEVAELLTGGSLNDLGIVATDTESIRSIVCELGEALHAFSEVGLRHRNLRPDAVLVRHSDPLDLVIGGFEAAKFSDFDLDIVAPLELTRYTAPEAVAGAVAAASDWWSLGMIILEQITRGECFRGINDRAYLIHIIANGVSLPGNLDSSIKLLLRGLLARDRHQRWRWEQVQAWLDGDPVTAPPESAQTEVDSTGSSIGLGGQHYRQPALFALAAAESQHWEEARNHLVRGVIVTWAQEVQLSPKLLAGLRRVGQHESLDENFRLMLALKLLNPEMPLIHKGEIVTPRWLLDHPIEGYDLIAGAVPDLLDELHMETWLSLLKRRAEVVRTRAKYHGIQLDEGALRVNILCTSHARLAAVWEERRRLLPDTADHGLLSIAERTTISEEDLIILLSAPIGLFRSCDAVVQEAQDLAKSNGLDLFDSTGARANVELPRIELMRAVGDRITGFASCPYAALNDWAGQFRIERRISLSRALVILAVPSNQWQEPQKQQYVSQILDFFEKKISTTVMRGPLVRMTIGKTTARVDLCELGTERIPASSMLEHLLKRDQKSFLVDPAAFSMIGTTEGRLQSLSRHTALYKRDTGIDGLYLGFPFLLVRDANVSTKTRIAPLLLWPVKVHLEIGHRGQALLSFDKDREEVRVNPALEGIVGADDVKLWRKTADEMLSRSSLKIAEVMDAFGTSAQLRARTLGALPSPSTELPPRTQELDCSAVLFHVTFIGQAIGEDLRQLKNNSTAGTSLETALRLNVVSKYADEPFKEPRELERFFTVSSDPSQEAAVLQARCAPGLLVEGPPGTGKSQTIVNMVGDAIGRRKSLLIVCQKHAALEVVSKRLVAEGLGDRIIMVNDVNKDRNPVIKAIREQIENSSRSGDPCAAVRRSRESVAAHIEALECELDRHHEALHKVDEHFGVSYRSLLGELIDLERPSAPLDLPALRPLLQKRSTSNLATLEEEVAPLVRYWLPANFEGSPLVQLQPFEPDRATLSDFQAAFSRFVEVERIRCEVLLSRPASFEVDDPVSHQNWLGTHGHRFLQLSDPQRLFLARWLPIFRTSKQEDTPGKEVLSGLAELIRELETCASQYYDQRLSPVLSKMQHSELKALMKRAAYVTRDVPWFCRLYPIRFLRKKWLFSFLRRYGAETHERIIALLHAGRLEEQWRPLRADLAKIYEVLQLPAISADAGPTLHQDAKMTAATLAEVAHLAGLLASAPSRERMDATALEGSCEAFLKLFATFDAAFARFEVRRASLSALNTLASWAEKTLVEQCRSSITSNQPNQSRIEEIERALPTLGAYQHFRCRAQRLSPEALATFLLLRTKEEQLRDVAQSNLENEVRRILNREARLGWKRAMEHAAPDLQLEQAELKGKVARLAAWDVEMRSLNRNFLKNDFDLANISGPREWDDFTRLTGHRARRLREFIEGTVPLGLMKLRPVWLMNPDVASRVLPLKSALFDVVIYDEASQIPVEHALPTLFRGRICVVSGDEKQMPPTAFFAGKVENDEAEAFDGETPDDEASDEERDAFEETWNRREIKDCPDLLQLARTNLPNTTLQIHYRSDYRELISFSNACFYGNHLSVPVRHPESTVRSVRPIEVIRTDSVYQEQTNPGEAAKVVEVLANLWLRPYLERPSVGVVTFNRKQADLIEDLLEQQAERDSGFRDAYCQERERVDQGEDMAVFVKNVENVQGDERDWIIFSSTFGRNSQGTFRRLFGVLGQKGGERRLNVAVTRARKKIIMVTSMPIRDISDVLSTHQPPATPRDFLQGYMEYARTMSGGEFETSRALLKRMAVIPDGRNDGGRIRSDDGFSKSVAEYLEAVTGNVIGSPEDDAFGLDFAIEDPVTGLFAIGIECDAPRHKLLSRARAREVWRPGVLCKTVPIIHRVSSHAWYHSPEEERNRLRTAIFVAMNRPVAA
ncbi:AAA domain-containing protein [Candidatus Nitrotoga sp. M5]|uniref:AAA domain-containing protein n=1 Tax=Candidatus Nitrotoga sp. M5 TaxID=2890409 RepID=UPI001EF532CB|nr:AAA domain-containing protein [Candidatus Nitrotoga sp. M5]CAH1387714.1 conserved hypothetical protein [Candidatus Nitrotoga sp. M5]